MRTAATPGGTFGSLARGWQRTGDSLCPRWHRASRSNAFGAETSAPLSDLIEALAPLGMPNVQYASRRAMTAGAREHALQSMSRAQRRPRSLSA